MSNDVPKALAVLVAPFLVAMLFAGCDAPPPAAPMNPLVEFKVGKLFEVDGCTVYRFEDGWSRYFTKCNIPAYVTENYNIPSGKTMRQDATTTVSVPAPPEPPKPTTFTMKCTITNGAPSCVQEK